MKRQTRSNEKLINGCVGMEIVLSKPNAGDCLVSASSKFFCFVLRGSLLEAPVPNGQEFNQDLNDETNFQDSPSHQILEHMHEALNVV